MFKEFREFAVKGNAVDMAVGIIIGAAFGAIVNSLVADIITPPIAVVMGSVDFSNQFFVLKDANGTGVYHTLSEAKKAGAVTLNYGVFLNSMINFLIVAFATFFLVRSINKLRAGAEPKKEEETPAIPTTKVCPYCKSAVHIEAVKCPHCVSDIT